MTETRTQNLTGGARCRRCNNDALVAVGRSKFGDGGLDEYGPCPECEMGFRVEFPSTPKKTGPWGPDGYWQGRNA